MSETRAPAKAPAEDPVEVVQFGLQWPEGDPGELREAARAWRDMAAVLETTRGQLDAAARRLTSANRGEAIDNFAGFWDEVSGDMSAVITACRQMADALEEFAEAVEEVREQIIQLAVEIAASIAIGVGLAFFTAGLSAAAVAATTARLIAVAGRLCLTLGLRAATIMSRVAVVGGFAAIESLAVNVTVQLGSNTAFNDNHDPLAGFSMDEALASGAFGAAVGGPLAGITSARHLAGLGNRGRGLLGEAVTAQAIRQQGGTVLGRQVSVYPTGMTRRVIPDFFTRNADGTLAWADSKVVQAGRRPTFTPGQRRGFPRLETVGGRPVGQNAAAAGLPPGVPVPPMPVTIHQWKW
ncbi:MAG: WXG100 family type VII secretion target [Acidimicrobiales bacterium]